MGYKETEVGKIPEEWNIYELKDLTQKIGSGATPRGGKKVYLQSGIPFIRSQNIYNCKFLKDGIVYINEESASKLNNVKLYKNDVLLNITGDSVARCTILPEKYIGGRINQHVAIIRSHVEILNPNFLKYYLVSDKMQAYMLSLAKMGATRAALTKGMIESFKIPTPPIEEQKVIVNILSTLDQKIEINNQINKNLEKIAQTIFKHWFVDFEFPDEDGKPYKSSGGEMVESELGMIPNGWEVIGLKDVCSIDSGYSYKGKELSDSNDAMITIKNFKTNGEFKIDGYKEIAISERVKDKHYAKEFDIIVAHTDLTQKAEIIGNPVMILTKSRYEKIIYSMDTVKVSPIKEFHRFFIYEQLKHSNFKNFALAHTSGTTVLHLSKKALPRYKLIMPDAKMINKYHELASSIFKRIKNLYVENINLEKLRDTLLPKLMSGEIRVPLDN